MIKQIDDWITARYGSRQGMLLTNEFRLMGYMGLYKHYRRVAWERAGRLVFVCKGNICRSAFAEAVAKGVGLDAISCGLNALHGIHADPQAVAVARHKGFDLRSHRSRRLADLSLADGDTLIAMEPWQLREIENLPATNNCTLLGLWGSPRLPYIQDPYGAPERYFEHCFSYIEKSVNEIAAEIKRSRN